jgi:hypothetical protein
LHQAANPRDRIMTMQLTDAFVSGSLGQAIFCQDRAFQILDGWRSEPRDALPNEIQFFRQASREITPAHPEGLPVDLTTVRSRLEEETRFFQALDGLLIGMDPDFAASTRRRSILRADEILSANGDVALRVRERFLVPANTQDWDPRGGQILASESGATSASGCYEPLVEGIIDRVSDDVDSAILERLGDGIEATRTRAAFLRSGLIARLADAGRERIVARSRI